jgi:hypothetical protein
MAFTWFILLLTIAGTAFLLLLFHRRFLGRVLHERIPDRPRRRLFVASLSFFLTFAGVRGVVYCIEHQIPPFHFIEVGGRHIHHLVSVRTQLEDRSVSKDSSAVCGAV